MFNKPMTTGGASTPSVAAEVASSGAPPWAIRATSLHKTFGRQAVLQNVNLEIPRGQFVCLLGASGCGKSTLLRLLAGLDSPDPPGERAPESADQGPTMGLRGADPARQANPRLGFVFQHPNLLPWQTVADNIALPLRLQGTAGGERRSAVSQALQQVGLSAADGRKWPWMLSGGMQMRASLARALVTRPEIMLLDEPFSALDEVLRQRLGEELRQWHQALGWTTVFVTHHVSEAVFLADRILVFRNVSLPQTNGPASTTGELTLADSIAADLTLDFSQPRVDSLREQRPYVERVVQVTKQFRETQR